MDCEDHIKQFFFKDKWSLHHVIVHIFQLNMVEWLQKIAYDVIERWELWRHVQEVYSRDVDDRDDLYKA